MTLTDRDGRLGRCGGKIQNQIHYGETEDHAVDDDCEMMMKVVVVMMINMMLMIMKVVVIIGVLYND